MRGSGITRSRDVCRNCISAVLGVYGVGSQDVTLDLSPEKEIVTFDAGMSALMRRGIRPGMLKMDLRVDERNSGF